jgi:hypothetical protein
VDEATMMLEYAVAKGLAVANDLVLSIKKTAEWRTGGKQPPALADRASFEQAYRDLAQFLSPVTAATLRNTSDAPEHGRSAFLLTWRHPLSEAKIWSRKLSLITGLVALVILISENTTRVLSTFFPGAILVWQVVASVMQSLEPFAYGALGAVIYLLRSAHTFIYERTFDKLRIPEYYNRILLGMVAGGAIKLFVTEVTTDAGEVIELSASALAFIAGYNSDFLFSAIERVSAAILPKVGLESVKRAGPDGPTVAAVQKLLDRYANATDDEKKALDKLLDRLVR